MYLGIDIGGTKTLVATLDEFGAIQEEAMFATPKKYDDFLKELATNVAKLSTKNFRACGVGAPGRLDRTHGIGLAFGNLPWKRVFIRDDVQHIVDCPVALENDAKLAALSESMLVPEFRKVLYITVSTGIGMGFVVDRQLDPGLIDSEAGHMILDNKGRYEAWEDFASGRAIVETFGKKAKDITDAQTWRTVARNLATGLHNLLAVTEPDIVILGGSVGAHLEKFQEPLADYLKKYETPMVPIPPIRKAIRPDRSVIYGCYDIAKQLYG